MDEGDIERAKLQLAVKQVEADLEIRRSDLQEKRAQRESDEKKFELEHSLKKLELELGLGKGVRFTNAQATVAAGLLALFSGLIGGFVQSWSAGSIETSKDNALIQQERIKNEAAEKLANESFETGLILKAISAPTRDEQVRNLRFFLSAGFIKDPSGKLAKIDVVNYPSLTTGPNISQASISSAPDLPNGMVDFISKFEGPIVDQEALRTQEALVKRLVQVPLSTNQLIALTSFVYNVGERNFASSSVLRLVRADDFEDAAKSLSIWNKLGGVVSPELTRRREAEAALLRAPKAPS